MTSTTLVVVNINKEMVSFARSARQHYSIWKSGSSKEMESKERRKKKVGKGGRIV